MSVYPEATMRRGRADALESELRAARRCGVEFVSKESALERLRQDFPELADVAVASTTIRSRRRSKCACAADAAAECAAAHWPTGWPTRPGVADVRYDRQMAGAAARAAVTAVRIGGLAIAAVLVLGAAFTVAAVVRLSLEARRAEVDIMQLVGAPVGVHSRSVRGRGRAARRHRRGRRLLAVCGALFGLWRGRTGSVNGWLAASAVRGSAAELGWSLRASFWAACWSGAVAGGLVASRLAR